MYKEEIIQIRKQRRKNGKVKRLFTYGVINYDVTSTYLRCIYSTCNLLCSTVCIPLRGMTSLEILLVVRYLITVGLCNWVTFQAPSFSSLFHCLPQVSAWRFIFICIILYTRFISICCENKPYFFGFMLKDLCFLFSEKDGRPTLEHLTPFHFISKSVWRFCL
jgi:hypothetical protein